MTRRTILWTLLGLILLVAVGLRLHGITARGLWLDEVLSWKLQTFPVNLMIQRTGEPTTTHPPLYFLILHVWTRLFGDSAAVMRGLSVVFGIATLPAMFLLLKTFGHLLRQDDSTNHGENDEKTTTAALLACIFLATSNLHIHQAQQVRGYTLAAFLTVISSVFLIRGLAWAKHMRVIWAAYTGSEIALIYTHNLGLFSVVAQGLFAVLYLWAPGAVKRMRGGNDRVVLRRARLLFSVSVLIVTVVYLPWLTRSLGQSGKLRTSWSKPVTAETIPVEVEQALTGTSTERVFQPTSGSWSFLAGLVVLGLLLVVLCGWPGVFLFLTGAVPPLLIYVYSLYSQRSIFDARYLMFAQQMWLAGAAWLVSRIPSRPERICAALIPASWLVFWCFDVQSTRAATAEPGIRAAVAHVVQHRRAEEIVIAETPFVFFGAQYYARNDCLVRVCAAERDRFLLNGESQLLPSDIVTPGDVANSPPAGIWVVTSTSYMNIAKSQSPTNCVAPSAAWKLEETLEFAQDLYWEQPVEIRHYVRVDAERAVGR